MIEQKKIWRTIYEYTKYSGFEYFTHGEAEDDIWLINRKKGIIKRVILKKRQHSPHSLWYKKLWIILMILRIQ